MVHISAAPLDLERGYDAGSDAHEGRMQTARREELAVDGKAPPDILALKPDWGKPTVRNFRGSGGNVGIIRSPVRATALPGGELSVAMVDLNAHAAGNGGQSQGKPKAQGVLLYSELKENRTRFGAARSTQQ